jgi:hypothetical protein
MQVRDLRRGGVVRFEPGQQVVERQDEDVMASEAGASRSSTRCRPRPRLSRFRSRAWLTRIRRMAWAAKKCPRPSNARSPEQPQVHLMYQDGGVEGVARRFGSHARGSERPQLVVHEREQVGRGLAVTGSYGVERTGHVGHHGRV